MRISKAGEGLKVISVPSKSWLSGGSPSGDLISRTAVTASPPLVLPHATNQPNLRQHRSHFHYPSMPWKPQSSMISIWGCILLYISIPIHTAWIITHTPTYVVSISLITNALRFVVSIQAFVRHRSIFTTFIHAHSSSTINSPGFYSSHSDWPDVVVAFYT